MPSAAARRAIAANDGGRFTFGNDSVMDPRIWKKTSSTLHRATTTIAASDAAVSADAKIMATSLKRRSAQNVATPKMKNAPPTAPRIARPWVRPPASHKTHFPEAELSW